MRKACCRHAVRWVVAAWVCFGLAGSTGAGEKPWALTAPVRPGLPVIQGSTWVRNPIDHFILGKLEAVGLAPAPAADRPTLLRRLTFDLIGLPPTPAEIDAFVNDPAPDAYEKQVERLLASPRFGEHWALYWLDLARYAESDGFKADDPRPSAWRYRDYVIQSFNDDKPYDRFVQEQLAGDELFPDDPQTLIATGFNRHFPDEYNAVNLEQRRQEILNDITDTTAQVFLGLTMGCARCHDHKFDPLTQEDYYRFQAFFAAYAPRDLPVASPAEIAHYQQQLHEWETQTAELRREMEALEAPYRKKFAAQRRARFPKEYQDLIDVPVEQRQPLQQQLVTMVLKQMETTTGEVVQAMKPDVKQHWQGLSKQMADWARLKPPAPPTALVLTDVGPTAPPTHLLRRGDWRHPAQEIEPGFIAVLDARPPSQSPRERTTGRRSTLAHWLTRPDNPLTARVMVNRLWQHHFGRGIVSTPGDFGAQGEPPTHPELLDWLACELVERGWSLKALHRLMVTSATYRQAAGSGPMGRKIDPDNRLLGHRNRRRLEGEALRDALLAVSGGLHFTVGGPSIYPELPPEVAVPKGGWPVSADVRDRNRRSIFIFSKRNLRYPLFSTFDAPDSNETCARRHVTTTAPQALLLLNDRLVLEQSRVFAARVLREAGPDEFRIIEQAYRLAVGRAPDAAEQQLLQDFLTTATAEHRERVGDEQAKSAAVADLCHVLFNLNEFLYVD
jgi:hypothetical protein